MRPNSESTAQVCLQNKIIFHLSDPNCPIATIGFSSAEAEGRWTDGPIAELSLSPARLSSAGKFIILKFEVRGFTHPGKIWRQRVILGLNGISQNEWSVPGGHFRHHVYAIDRSLLRKGEEIVISFRLPDYASPSSLGSNPDGRSIGIMIKLFGSIRLPSCPLWTACFGKFGRSVGGEAGKTFDERIENGFWERFVTGPRVLDIGFRGYEEGILPIFPDAIGVDTDYPGYDGRTLPFSTGSQDAVFSSHCLEHIADYINAIQEW